MIGCSVHLLSSVSEGTTTTTTTDGDDDDDDDDDEISVKREPLRSKKSSARLIENLI